MLLLFSPAEGGSISYKSLWEHWGSWAKTPIPPSMLEWREGRKRSILLIPQDSKATWGSWLLIRKTAEIHKERMNPLTLDTEPRGWLVTSNEWWHRAGPGSFLANLPIAQETGSRSHPWGLLHSFFADALGLPTCHSHSTDSSVLSVGRGQPAIVGFTQHTVHCSWCLPELRSESRNHIAILIAVLWGGSKL